MGFILLHRLLNSSRRSYLTLTAAVPVVMRTIIHNLSRMRPKLTLKTEEPGLANPIRRKYSNWTSCEKTIFALSSGFGKSGVAIIRVSGFDTEKCLRKMTRRNETPKPRVASLRTFYKHDSGEPIDTGILIWFKGAQSFTGEDSCEFHVHGGSAVVAAMLNTLGTISHLRPAEAGEFTKRAFLNGKLDLTEAEGLGDLIQADTEAQRKQAYRQMNSGLSKIYSEWRNTLIKCAANVEAYIDFSEDENIEEDVLDHVDVELTSLLAKLRAHLSDSRQGERLRNGVQVTIIGEPNIGKSSLLNKICERPAAIVSPIAGTTRDIVDTALDIGGYPVVISDTAGLRDTVDLVEKEGVRRAFQRTNESDLKIVMTDVRQLSAVHAGNIRHFIEEHLKKLGFIISKSAENEQCDTTSGSTVNCDDSVTSDSSVIDLNDVILVFNKLDLIDRHDKNQIIRELKSVSDINCCVLSCETEHGFDEFLETLKNRVQALCGNPSMGDVSFTRSRHRLHITRCLDGLQSYLYLKNTDIVLAANELRKSIYQLGKITGQVTTDEILDVLFKDFCIGK
ncbi:5-taurinomethyluridine-[tRNA] synthase subunit GTPB3, mitochondrial-like [Tubulanus polymorphus]|uniref:5-taurinomethyluridine-[tRNA] synthase subunit GTPB3, mitochondrial-like n=1 Tax=Tubulanus polymorphus TaxID=672921 RepID=UPI003DA28BD4